MSQERDDAHAADTVPEPPDARVGPVSMVQDPPKSFWQVLRRLGPGLIIAGSIVGSGELIATTKTAAEAGISLLWLIVIGCLIKVFCQVELGRYTICHGQTTLSALNTLPGPRFKVNWIIWFWILMMIAGIGQLGGIVGGVGQALAIAVPFRGDYVLAIAMPAEKEWRTFLQREAELPSAETELEGLSRLERARRAEQLQRIELGQKFLARKIGGGAFQDAIAELRAGPDADSPAIQAKIQSLEKQLAAHQQQAQRTREAVLALIAAEKPVKEAEAHLVQLRETAAGETAVAAAEAQWEQARAANAAAIGQAKQQVNALLEPRTWDDKYWAALATLVTMALLYRGRYGIVQNLSTVLVVTFTFITIGNVIALEAHPSFRLTAADFLRGFGLPEEAGLATALATFGIIGVGASELISYPYWCLEKGYARFTGPLSQDAAWERRARGWLRVMHYDAFTSMIIYTVATVAFFIMGVAVLHKQGLVPDGMRMVSTLLEQYRPVFGEYARWLFLIGAIAVLYSTFLVSTASHSRTITDSFKIFGAMRPDNQQSHSRSVSILCLVIPVLCLAVFCAGLNPVSLVMGGAFMQALLLPALGYAALHFRYTKTDPRLKPGRVWDTFLIISFVGLFITGVWNLYELLGK